MDNTKNPSYENSPSTNNSKNFNKLCDNICQSDPNLLKLKNKLIRDPHGLDLNEIVGYLKSAKNIGETIGEQNRITQSGIVNLYYDFLFTDYKSWKEDFSTVQVEFLFPHDYAKSEILPKGKDHLFEIPKVIKKSIRNIIKKIMNYSLGDHPREELWFYAYYLPWLEGERVSEMSFFDSLYNLVFKFKTIYEVRENYNNILQGKLLIKSREKSNENIAIAPFPSETDWREISITFLSEISIKIKVRDYIRNADFSNLGFINKKNKKPNSLWMMLKILAQHNGEISFQTNVDNRWKIKKKVSELRKILKSLFEIDSDPFFDYKKCKAYKTRFKLRYEVSSDTPFGGEIFNEMRKDLPSDSLGHNDLK